MEDGGRPMSPASQPQASIKQEVDHHLPDFHDNISLPVSNLLCLCISRIFILINYFFLYILHLYSFKHVY